MRSIWEALAGAGGVYHAEFGASRSVVMSALVPGLEAKAETQSSQRRHTEH
jgi:hypothetical protein